MAQGRDSDDDEPVQKAQTKSGKGRKAKDMSDSEDEDDSDWEAGGGSRSEVACQAVRGNGGLSVGPLYYVVSHHSLTLLYSAYSTVADFLHNYYNDGNRSDRLVEEEAMSERISHLSAGLVLQFLHSWEQTVET